jgi:FkbH-like protein
MRFQNINQCSSEDIYRRYAEIKNLRELLACIREFDSNKFNFSNDIPSVRLSIIANYSTQFLEKGFPLALASRGVNASFFVGEYNSWQYDLLDEDSKLYSFLPTHVLLLLTSIDLAYGSLRTPAQIANAVCEAAEKMLRITKARLLITLPEPLSEEISDQSEAYVWRKKTCELLRQKLTNNRINLIDLDPLICQVGAEKWHDERFYDTSKIPFHPDQTPKLLERLASAIVGTVAPQCKLVICDLDDTLWAGRVGDEGWDGINLDAAGSGRHHLRLQLFLKGLAKQGVLLAIASKNEMNPVLDIFKNRPEMILEIDDFVSSQIHWKPKSDSVQHILASLNLSTAGVIFLDDNPAEREEVRNRFPDIFIPELSVNPALWVNQLIESGIFDRRVITEESTKRLLMYKENAQREAQITSSTNIQGFLSSLNMELTVYDAMSHIDRVLELIQKTNQFNVTTHRYGIDEITRLKSVGLTLCHRLTDRFGDNGIISVLIVKSTKPKEFIIDVFLMSCRVMSRTVENAIIMDLIRRLAEKGADRIVGEFIPTTKNAPVSELYERLGFKLITSDIDKKVYEYRIDKLNDSKTTSNIQIIDSFKMT